MYQGEKKTAAADERSWLKVESMHTTIEIADAMVGRRILSYALGAGRESITFETDRGTVRLLTMGECCSQTWIESLDVDDALLGDVTAVEEIPMPNLGDISTPHRGDVDSVTYYALHSQPLAADASSTIARTATATTADI